MNFIYILKQFFPDFILNFVFFDRYPDGFCKCRLDLDFLGYLDEIEDVYDLRFVFHYDVNFILDSDHSKSINIDTSKKVIICTIYADCDFDEDHHDGVLSEGLSND